MTTKNFHVGPLVSGPDASIVGNTLNDTTFSGQSGNSITLASSADDNQEINATGVTFGSSTGAASTLAQRFAIEDKITDAVDNASLGFVRVVSAQVFVTPSSGSIQRGIDAAAVGNTVSVAAGTFNENVDVNKAKLTLLGAGPNSTTILGLKGGLGREHRHRLGQRRGHR